MSLFFLRISEKGVCTVKHIVDIKDLSGTEILSIVKRALYLKKSRVIPRTLDRKYVVTAFFEPSTRTKLSFQRAALSLGAKVIDLAPDTSSMLKGETELDTLLTIEAMDVDAIVIRTRRNGDPTKFSKHLQIPVINAGDGTNEHPTQALLDITTMYEHYGKFNLSVAIVGDINHSRVARSLTEALAKLGGSVIFCGPEEFIPKSFPDVSLITTDLQEAISNVDVIYALRIQKERIEEVCDNIEEFFKNYQINESNLEMAPKHAILMHPGPFNRNVEVSDGVVYSSRSRILDQVRNGVYSRMAVLEKATGAYEYESIQSIEKFVVI